MTATKFGTSPTEGSTANETSRASRVLPFLEAYALVGLLILVIIFFSTWSRTSAAFPTLANLQIVLTGQSVLAIVALGVLIPLVCSEWDLSVGASTALSAVTAAKLLSNGMSPVLALALGASVGIIVGVVNALLVTRLGTNAVITTLGTAALVAGVINQITNGATQVSNIPEFWTSFGAGKFFGIPNLFCVMIVLALATNYLLEHTPFGRRLFAIGSNRNAAHLVGIRLKWQISLAFILAGVLAGMAGILQIGNTAAADPRIGDSLMLQALAAAFLSAAAIKPGRYSVAGMLVALFLLAFINSGLTIAGAPPYVTQYVNGGALIIGVGLAVNLGRRRERS
jgi:ribose transport system permease protein